MRKISMMFIAFFISIVTFAADQNKPKTLDLLASPNNNAAIVASMPVGAPIIPVIRQQGWVKVADPKTGAVGWIQSNKIDQSPVVITQVIAGNGDYCKDNNCQFSFYSNNQMLSPQNNQVLWQKMREQEKMMMAQQLAMQKRMSEFMADMNALMAKNIPTYNDGVMQTQDEKTDQSPTQTTNKEKSFWKFWEK
jgi:hypothetical protein